MPRPTTSKPQPPKKNGRREDGDPTLAFETAQAFSSWLSKHHAKSQGVWLRIAKKGSGLRSVTYAEAVDVALSWGWIDGLRRAHDASAFVQRFTPRKSRSIWSVINRKKALALIAAGTMKAPGLAEVERAKRDGRWKAAYHGQKAAAVPADLAQALAKNARAKAFFETLNSQNRFSILFRTHQAKKPETRARRIATFVAMLAKHETIYP